MNTAGLAQLSVSERQALALLGKGYDVKACAAELGVSDNAITERLRSARRKLGVTSSREAARLVRDIDDDPPSFSGDSFSGLVGDPVQPSSPCMPAGQAERMAREEGGSDLREFQMAYAGFDEAPTILPYLPLRGVDARGNPLSKAQRVQAMVDLSIKIAAVAALVCMIALVLNMVSLS
jgi:DNA-binding CsgD family transcriptional regulator